MAIRRRAKPLTQAEVIDLAKKENFPNWFGSEPLLAGALDADGTPRAYPLDVRLNERPWLLYFVDPFRHSTRQVIRMARFWSERYESQKLGTILVFRMPYSFARDPEWARKAVSNLDQFFITVMDRDRLLSNAFHVGEEPKLVLLYQNQEIFVRSGADWFTGIELEMQRFFRKSDPGLPLFPVHDETEKFATDTGSVELGGWMPGQSSVDLPGGKSLTLAGDWKRESERIVTSDPMATLSFFAGGSRVALIAQKASDAHVDIQLELSREFPKTPVHDDDLKVDLHALSNPLVDPTLKRRALISVDEPRLYHLLRDFPVTHRDITLRFPSADKAPVAIYGLRFGE